MPDGRGARWLHLQPRRSPAATADNPTYSHPALARKSRQHSGLPAWEGLTQYQSPDLRHAFAARLACSHVCSCSQGARRCSHAP